MVCPDCIEQTLGYSDICPLLWVASPRSLVSRPFAPLDGVAVAPLAPRWRDSARAGEAHGQDAGDEVGRIAYLWTELLANGPARQWRSQLFDRAIPNALREGG